MNCGSTPGKEKCFSLPHSTQVGSVLHAASYSLCNGDYFPGLKRPRHESDYSTISSADVNNSEAASPLHHIRFVARTGTDLPLRIFDLGMYLESPKKKC
jgi:hypothetical protein